MNFSTEQTLSGNIKKKKKKRNGAADQLPVIPYL